MLNEDQYVERTPDLVAKVRAMRHAAEKEMNRFTCLTDYDSRRIVGHGPKAAPVSDETVPSPSTVERPKRSSVKLPPAQTSIEFAPAPAERGDEEDA